jgi:hypothetical protein
MCTENTTVGKDTPTATLQHEGAAEPVDAAVSAEAKGPKTETDALGQQGRKRGRSDSRQRKKQKLRPGILKRRCKLKIMRAIIEALRKCPTLWRAALKAGIHRKTLEYMIKCSKAGRDGYELKHQGINWGFHEHCEAAIAEAHQRVLDDLLDVALRAIYKTDPSLVELGYQGSDAYAKDENGAFIIEGYRIRNPKIARVLLEWYRPEIYGKPRNEAVPRSGGVLVVGQITKKPKPKRNTAASIRARRWKSLSRKVSESKT